MKLQGSAVLIKPTENPKFTRSGKLEIPKSVKKFMNTGIVIEVGPACKELVKGDVVKYKFGSASIITMDDDKEYHFVYEKEIFGKIIKIG